MADTTQQESTGDSKFRVVVCVDSSENSERAFNFYVEHVHKSTNYLILMHVAEVVGPEIPFVGPGGAFAVATLMEQQFEAAKKKTHDLKKYYTSKCKEREIECEFVALTHYSGGVGEAIVEGAKKKDAELIFMGSRGLGVVRRTILGSVSDYVLHHSHVPTMICPLTVSKQE